MKPQTEARKTTWFIIFFAMVASVGVYGLLCFILMQSRSAPPVGNGLQTLRPILYVVAVGDVLASIAWVHFKTNGRIGGTAAMPSTGYLLMKAAEFQTVSIVGLALAEACAIFGLLLFFLGAPITEFALFAVATLAVDLLYILPKGITYWAAWEQQQSR